MCRSDRQSRSFDYSVSGQDLWLWRQQALQDAIAHKIPSFEVDWFLQALTPLTRLDLRLASFKTAHHVPLSIAIDDLKCRWAQRLRDRVPLQYLVGYTQWREFQLTVSTAVLIPRPETELLIDLAVAATEPFPALRQGHWVDLGTGSGAIALGLAVTFPNATVHGVDCSEAALAIATQNIQNNSIQQNGIQQNGIQQNGIQQKNKGHNNRDGSPLHQRIHLHQGSWFSPWVPPSQATLGSALHDAVPSALQFSGIVSNPPYIPSDQIWQLQPEVTRHEPHLALDGGSDGLACLRHLINQSATYLIPNGILLLEMMAGQAEAVVHLINHHGGYHSTEIYADLAGLDRFVLTRRAKIKPDQLVV